MGGHPAHRLDATAATRRDRPGGRGGRSLRAAIKLVRHYDLLMTLQSTPVNHRARGHYPAICRQHAARLIDSKAAVSSIVYSAGTAQTGPTRAAIAVDRVAPPDDENKVVSSRRCSSTDYFPLFFR